MKIFKSTAVMVFIFTVALLVACSKQELEQQVGKITPVETILVTRDDVVRYHQIPTVFIAQNRANLAFQLSGSIEAVMVKIGQKVEKHQELMELYNTQIDPALETNLAQLESIRAQIEQAKRDVASLKELRKNNSTSKNAFERKETDLKDLIAKEKSVQAQIGLALANQSQTFIKAPFSGTVVAIEKQVGEFVAAGQVVMAIYQQDGLEVEINITQSLWKNISLGESIKGIYDDSDVEFRIVELAQTAEAKSHLMKVILQLNKTIDNAIGQQVILNLPQVYDKVYQLPLEVIVDDGINKPYIFSVVNEKAYRNYIRPLFVEDGQVVFQSLDTEIKGAVVTKGQSKISEGMQLQVLP